MIDSNSKFYLNQMNTTAGLVQLGTLVDKTVNVAKAQFDFATLGGAVGDIDLGVTIPAKAIVTNVMVDVLTAPTSAGAATLALKLETAADLLAATAKASVTGIMQGIPVAGSATTAVKTTVDRNVKATVAVAALTAGKLNVFVTYVLSE